MLKPTALVALLSLVIQLVPALPAPAPVSSGSSNVDDNVSPTRPPSPAPAQAGRGRGVVVNQPIHIISQHYEVPGTIQHQPDLINIYNHFQRQPGTVLEEGDHNERHLATMAVRVAAAPARADPQGHYRRQELSRSRRAARERQREQARAAAALAAIDPTFRIDRPVHIDVESYQRTRNPVTGRFTPEVHRPVAAVGSLPRLPQAAAGSHYPVSAFQQHHDMSAFSPPRFAAATNMEATSSMASPQQQGSFQSLAGDSSIRTHGEGTSSTRHLQEHDLLARFSGGAGGQSSYAPHSGPDTHLGLDVPRQRVQQYEGDVDTHLTLGRVDTARERPGWHH